MTAPLGKGPDQAVPPVTLVGRRMAKQTGDQSGEHCCDGEN